MTITNGSEDNDRYAWEPALDHFSTEYGSFHLPLTSCICIFGCVTNVLNVIVLTRRHMITPSNVLLTGMSVAQFFLAINYVCLITYSIFAKNCINEGVLHSYEWTIFKWVNVNLSVVLHTTALLHTTCLSLFRYIAIRKPHYSQSTLTVGVCKKCSFAMHVLTPVLCCPTFFVTSVQRVEEVGDLQCNLREAYNLNYSKGKNQFWKTTLSLFGIVCKLLPGLTIALLTCNLMISLKKFDLLRERLKGTSNIKRKLSQQRLSKMLLVVAALCLSVEIPHGVLQICTAALGEKFGVEIYDNLGDFFEMLTLLYNSVNFVLYCAMSSEFRRTFDKLMLAPLRIALFGEEYEKRRCRSERSQKRHSRKQQNDPKQ